MATGFSGRPDRAALAYNVKRLRVRRGWSQEELAAIAGEMRQAVISQIETGRANPTMVTLEQIAAALEVRVYDLLKPPRARSVRRSSS